MISDALWHIWLVGSNRRSDCRGNVRGTAQHSRFPSTSPSTPLRASARTGQIPHRLTPIRN